MKFAVIGKLKHTTSYQDWCHCFRRRFWKNFITEISITGSDTILNSYESDMPTYYPDQTKNTVCHYCPLKMDGVKN